MFGRRKLSKVGMRASADVLTAEQSPVAVTFGNPNLVGNTRCEWNLRLRVMPDNELPFEATVKALLPQLTMPRPGSRLAVRYDPDDHSRVELDDQPMDTAGTAIDAITSARPDLAGARVMGMPVADVIRQAIADPNGFRAEMMQRSADMQKQAMAAMQAAEAAQPSQASDPVDRLERLAALKDRGLLTDEEFEQQKRKILGD